MGSDYERELKKILMADRKGLRKAIRGCSIEEELAYLSIEKRPFVVVRAAGSFGVDLVAVRGDISFLIEVKSSQSPVFRFSRSRKLQEQAVEMMDICRRSSLFPVYAYRLKGVRGDAWRIFTREVDGLTGKARIIHARIPKIEISRGGNMIMRWEDGMKLSELIGYLCSD